MDESGAAEKETDTPVKLHFVLGFKGHTTTEGAHNLFSDAHHLTTVPCPKQKTSVLEVIINSDSRRTKCRDLATQRNMPQKNKKRRVLTVER